MQALKSFSLLLLTGCLATAGCAGLRLRPDDKTLDQGAASNSETAPPESATTEAGLDPTVPQETKATDSLQPAQPQSPTAPAAPVPPLLKSAPGSAASPVNTLPNSNSPIVSTTQPQNGQTPLVSPAPPATPTESVQPKLTEQGEKLLASLSLRQKIGQLFMIGFMGQKIDEGLAKSITSAMPGGIVVFGRNITSARQISDLNIAAQKLSIKASKVPLLIAVDQEGGNVIRIKTAMPLPSALALGETGDQDLVEAAGLGTGQLLKTLRFNMNLAPVLDVADPKANSFIGTRTFGNDPATAGKMGVRFAVGLHRAGVLATAKHFPGHGGVSEDSHLETPTRSMTLQDLKTHDLVPFGGMRRNLDQPWAIMLAHISYPNVDPTGMPATFSKVIVSDILRKRMKFDGLVLTDDIEMAGAFAVKDVSERAVRAIEAGADMIMVAWNKKMQLKVTDAVLQAVQKGRLSEARLNTSVRRIPAYKTVYATSNLNAPTLNELKVAVRNPEFQRIAEATVSHRFRKALEKIDDEFLQMAADNPVFVFSANERFYTSFKENMGKHLSRYYPIGSDGALNIDKVMRSNPNAVGVFYVSGPQAAKAAGQISEDVARRILVVSVEPQGAITNAKSFRSIADVYFRHPNLGKLTALQLFPADGRPRQPATDRTKPKAPASVQPSTEPTEDHDF